MTKCKKPTPCDPKLIAERCNPLALRLGCAAGCWKHDPSLMPPLSGVWPYDPMRVFALCDPS